MKRDKIIAIAIALFLNAGTIAAQERLYPNTFSLGDVTLLDGQFKHAQELNLKVLLKYDVDRLLAPYLKEAGLPKKAECFPNWSGLDGHVAGHYLSAMAMNYASTGNQECKKRMDYMISELKRCQDKNGNGYLGGVPDGMQVWEGIKSGHPEQIWKLWAPWYNIHKMYAGLRDAWLYTGNEEARTMFLKLCDWAITIISPLSDAQMEAMLENEFGGMNESFADAYQMTKDEKYLIAAKRFSHRWLLDSMVKGVDNLDNKHANTQVPKVIGYGRVAQLDNNADYKRAATFFWDCVANRRSLSFGGNSRREHFPSKDDCISYVEDRQGPETCNTYNMLKLTEDLFRMDPKAEYAEFYERALFNHILSSQHPEHGGYVYFTSARPSHYRVYSTPNSAMWCCVGTGMENHSKYEEFIYTHSGDSLFVNLFIASNVQWKDKNVSLTQMTQFPDQSTSRLIVNVKKPTRFKLLIRRPSWVKGDMKVICNGKDYAAGVKDPSYIVINRIWKNGESVTLDMPMGISVESLPNVPNYLSLKYGPIVLASRNGTQDLVGLKADDSRFGQIADGPLVSIFDAPYMRGSREEIEKKLSNIKPVKGEPLCFTVPDLFGGDKFSNMKLEPFFRVHDCRYCVYWLSMDDDAYNKFQSDMLAKEKAKMELDRRTIDRVAPGEQQPETDHAMKNERSSRGYYEGEPWRDASGGGYFSYMMNTNNEDNLSLMVRYWGNENSGNRTFDILIDGKLLVTENTKNKWRKNEFVNVEYTIPAEMIKGKSKVEVKFQPKDDAVAGGIFYVRLLKKQL
jgi:uncharacterized protein